jgi:hypothetical protein
MGVGIVVWFVKFDMDYLCVCSGTRVRASLAVGRRRGDGAHRDGAQCDEACDSRGGTVAAGPLPWAMYCM